jgi:hypothetical protein
MDPNNSQYSSSGFTPQQQNSLKRYKILAVVAGIIILLIIIFAYAFYGGNKPNLNLVSVSPKKSDISTQTPKIVFTFDHALSPDNIKLSSEPKGAVQGHNVDGKKLNVILTTLKEYKHYTLTIDSVSGKNGATLHGKTYRFAPKPVPFDKLPKKQQKQTLQVQKKRPQSRLDYNYVGADGMTDYGLSQIQANDAKQAVYLYIKKHKLDVSTITFSDITPPPGSNFKAPYKFTVSLDDTDYHATLTLEANINAAELNLYNAGGTHVYDSGVIDVTQE